MHTFLKRYVTCANRFYIQPESCLQASRGGATRTCYIQNIKYTCVQGVGEENILKTSVDRLWKRNLLDKTIKTVMILSKLCALWSCVSNTGTCCRLTQACCPTQLHSTFAESNMDTRNTNEYSLWPVTSTFPVLVLRICKHLQTDLVTVRDI